MAKKEKKRTAKVIVITAIIAVSFVIIIFGGFYIGFVYNSARLADKAVEIYESGTGADLKELIAPGYINYCEKNLTSISVEQLQQTHIDDFHGLVYDKIGEIKKIEAERTGIFTISNVEELAGEFAQYGVEDVTKYRCVKMRWHITGEKGSTDMDVEVYVLKCKDGWFLDYVRPQSGS